jgi:hypothetical protein
MEELQSHERVMNILVRQIFKQAVEARDKLPPNGNCPKIWMWTERR